MGIDTKDRRKSVVNWFLRLLPSPDTVIDIADRAQIGGLYRGVFAALKTRLLSSDLLIKKLNIFINTTSDIILSASQIATSDRRKSVTNSISRILPFPDGVINAADRRHVAGFYRHITYIIRNLGTGVDLLIKKLNIDSHITSDLLIKKSEILNIASDLLIKKLGDILSTTSDLLVKKFNVDKYITSDLLIKKVDIISTTSDLLVKKLSDILSTTSDLLVKKLNIFTSFTSDVIVAFRTAVPVLCDISIKKLGDITSTTVDIIISTDFNTEYINLRSYINLSENEESVITTSINDDSDIMISLSKFSETDSDISIIRYSSIDVIN